MSKIAPNGRLLLRKPKLYRSCSAEEEEEEEEEDRSPRRFATQNFSLDLSSSYDFSIGLLNIQTCPLSCSDFQNPRLWSYAVALRTDKYRI
jgi:hypothetical protein